MHLERLAVAVKTINGRLAGRGAQHPQQQPQQRGLAGAIGPQKPKYFTLIDLQRTSVQGRGLTVTLRQAIGFNVGQRLNAVEIGQQSVSARPMPSRMGRPRDAPPSSPILPIEQERGTVNQRPS